MTMFTRANPKASQTLASIHKPTNCESSISRWHQTACTHILHPSGALASALGLRLPPSHRWAIAPQYIKQFRNALSIFKGVCPNNSTRSTTAAHSIYNPESFYCPTSAHCSPQFLVVGFPTTVETLLHALCMAIMVMMARRRV